MAPESGRPDGGQVTPVPLRPVRAGALGDVELADEIELYGAVVVAASEKDGSLTPAEIDDALGVDDASTADGGGTPGTDEGTDEDGDGGALP